MPLISFRPEDFDVGQSESSLQHPGRMHAPTTSSSSMQHELSASDQARGAGPSSSSNGSSGHNSSLFNADEARFMHDSFSSAESFDPFTVGAPGFKVPNVLPANLGGIGAAPGAGQGLSGMSMVSSAGSDGMANSAGVGRGGGYGQSKQWQLQQLHALQAERYKYITMRQNPSAQQQQQQQFQNHQRTDQSFSMIGNLAGPSSLPDTSTIGQSLQEGEWLSQMQGGGMDPGHPLTYGESMGMMGHRNSHGGDLSSLGANFPSSHQFPGSGHPSGMSTGQQHGGRADAFRGSAMGTDVQGKQDGFNAQRPPMWYQSHHGMPAPADSQGVQMNVESGKKGGGTKGKSAANPQSGSNTTPDPEAPYVFHPAPRPPQPTIDLGKIEEAHIIPDELHDPYFAPTITRLQPHLAILRNEQMRRKEQGLSANIRKDRKDAKQPRSGGGGDEDGADSGDGKKKQTHVLLTEAEKKANHIASEQKRRANIRKGYEMLCALIPSLREGLGEGEEGEGGEDDNEEEEEEEEDEEGGEGDTKRGKKRRAGESASAADKIDGKSGPRSEAIILMKAVDHIRAQIEEHHALVVRKQKLQRQIAERYGADAACLTAPSP